MTIAEPFAAGRFTVTFTEWDAYGRGEAVVGGATDVQTTPGAASRGAGPSSTSIGKTLRPMCSGFRRRPARLTACSPKPSANMQRRRTRGLYWWGASIAPADANYDGNYVSNAGGGERGESAPARPCAVGEA